MTDGAFAAPPVDPPVPSGAMCASHPEIGAAFTCSRCGNYGCPGCAFSAVPGREACRICAAYGMGEPIPWERRRDLGWWRSFWHTTKLASRRPAEFFRTPPTEGSAIWPVVYGVAVYSFGQYVYMAILALALVVLGIVAAVGTGEALIGAFIGGYSVVVFALVLVQAPVYGFMGILVGAALTHGSLAIMKKANAGFEHTLRAVSYANAPYFWYFIPCIGPLFAWFWMVWTEVVAIRETHRIGTDRAALAVIGYRAVLIFTIVAVYAGFFALVYYAETVNR